MRFFTSILLAAALLVTACTQTAPDTDTGTDASASVANKPVAQVPMVASTGEMCGGIAGIQCIEGDFCLVPDGQCISISDASGTCTTLRPMCTREYRPVCGCDGDTYSNKCVAHAAGVSIASEGPCEQNG